MTFVYKYWKLFEKRWSTGPLFASCLVFLFFATSILFLFSMANGDPVADDHYFHFKYAYLLRTEGWNAVQNFDWIYLTGLAEGDSRYTVNLYQISLIPFTYISDWFFGLRVADTFFGSFVLAVCYFIMRKARVKHALLFTFLIFGFSYFAYRVLLGRAFVLIIGILFLEMFFTIEKRYKSLFFLSFLHVLWHQSTYFMPLAIVGAVEAARYLVYFKFYFKNIFAVISAIILGMIFFPGFPMSILSLGGSLFSLQTDAAIGGGAEVNTLGGKELLSKDFFGQFVDAEMILALFIFCVIAVAYIYTVLKKNNHIFNTSEKKKNIVWIFSLFVFTIVMMFGTISVSGRVFDFFVPAIFLLSGVIITFFVQNKIIHIEKTFQKFFLWGAYVLAGIFVIGSYIHIYERANTFDYEPTEKVAQWIQEESDGKEKVFLHNWSNFTILFFGNSQNVYSMGIEPTALKGYDSSLYWKYYNIYWYGYYCTEERDCEEEMKVEEEYFEKKPPEELVLRQKENSKKIINSIKNDFDAKFIVSDTEPFSNMILLNPELIEDYFHVQSKKFNGKWNEFTVFKLK